MQNKLYTIIANIYNELKAFKGGKPTLEDAVISLVDESKEVKEARQGHINLDARLNDMQELINNKSLDLVDVYNKIKDAKEEVTQKIPSATVQVLSDETKDVIVALSNKISRKEDILTVPGNGGTATLVNNNEFYVSKAYMNSLDSAVVIKSVSFDNASKVNLDAAIETLSGGVITANGLPELFEVPFVAVDVLQTEEMDTCYLHNLCNVVSDYCSVWNDALNQKVYTNHLVNAFREGKEWIINRNYVSFIMTFTEPIMLAKAHMELQSVSTTISYSLDISTDGSNWANVTKGLGSLLDFTLTTIQSCKYIKISVNSFDGTPGRDIKIKNTKIYTTKYNDNSSLVTTVEPIIFDYYNSQITVTTKNPTDTHKLIEHRYAITNDADDDKDWYTYIPSVLTLPSKLFRDSKGFRVIKDVIKNNYRFDKNSKTLVDPKTQAVSPSQTVSGTLGLSSINRGDIAYSRPNSWKPSTQIIMYIEAVIKGVTYTVPMDINNINDVYKITIAGVDFNVTIRVLDTRVIKVSIIPVINVAGLKADSIRVNFLTPRNNYTDKSYWNYTTSVANVTGFDYNIKGHPYSVVKVDSGYTVARQYGWFWFTGWSYIWSPYNGTETGATCAILSRDIYSGTVTSSQTYSDGGDNFLTTVERKNCDLPVTVYLGTGGESVIKSVLENDIENVQTLNINPLFLEDDTYTVTQYIADAKLTAIIPQQSSSNEDNIQYAISFDGYNYFTYDNVGYKWKAFAGQGMTISTLTALNDSQFELLRKGDDTIYIKVIIKGLEATINNITLNFENDKYVIIKENEISTKGMTKSVIENMKPGTLQASIFNLSPVLYIAAKAFSDYPAFMYKLTGYDINDYKDVKWQEIDNVKVLEYLLGNGTLMYKNTTTSTLYVKVIRNLIENKSAVIDVRDQTKDLIKQLEDKQTQLLDTVTALDQNLTLMHDTFVATGGVPTELPTVMLPNIKSYETGDLAKNDEYVINDADSLRGIQVWEQKSNFVGYVDRLDYEATSKDNFTTSLIDIIDTGAQLSTDYDKDNPYLVPETLLSTSNGGKKYTYQMHDVITTITPNIGSLNSMMEDSGEEKSWQFWHDGYGGWTYGGSRYNIDRGLTAIWDLPGENTRWVDIILDFRGMTWINYINNLYFGQWSSGPDDPGLSSCTNQITTFSYSKDGNEFIDVASYTNYKKNITVNFNIELRYIRIRLELPYSVNKGAGRVTFTQMNVYFSPVHYIHDTDCYIFNSIPIDTENWNNFSSISVDRYIDHNPCEMKFLLSDDPNHVVWKYWDGSKWVSVATISMANSMSIETLLALNSNQLNQLEKGSLYMCAIMKTTDIWKTPILRSVEFKHDSFTTQNYYELIDPHSIDIKYFLDNKTIVIRNNDDDVKKLKITLL
jgi:hypothetical protein